MLSTAFSFAPPTRSNGLRPDRGGGHFARIKGYLAQRVPPIRS